MQELTEQFIIDRIVEHEEILKRLKERVDVIWPIFKTIWNEICKEYSKSYSYIPLYRINYTNYFSFHIEKDENLIYYCVCENLNDDNWQFPLGFLFVDEKYIENEVKEYIDDLFSKEFLKLEKQNRLREQLKKHEDIEKLKRLAKQYPEIILGVPNDLT